MLLYIFINVFVLVIQWGSVKRKNEHHFLLPCILEYFQELLNDALKNYQPWVSFDLNE